jgi:hypothetical protein
LDFKPGSEALAAKAEFAAAVMHRESTGEIAVAEAALDDVFIDDITPLLQSRLRHSGTRRQAQTSDVQLHIGESRDSGFDASHRPGMTGR